MNLGFPAVRERLCEVKYCVSRQNSETESEDVLQKSFSEDKITKKQG